MFSPQRYYYIVFDSTMDCKQSGPSSIQRWPGLRRVREVVFKDGLRKIGREAFRDYTSLESIALPSTVIEIGDNAFDTCVNLREVELNDGLQNIGREAFYNCKSLENITLPTTVTEIGINAFFCCLNLRAVTFNNGLQKIGDHAFSNCILDAGVKLPISVDKNKLPM